MTATPPTTEMDAPTKCSRCDRDGTRECTREDECDGWMYCDCPFGQAQQADDYNEQERQANLTTEELMAERDAARRESDID